MDAKQVQNFLNELGALCRKHKIRVEGCGCCGSPFLEDVDEESRMVPLRVQMEGENFFKLETDQEFHDKKATYIKEELPSA